MISLLLIFGFLCRSSIFPYPDDREIWHSNVLVLDNVGSDLREMVGHEEGEVVGEPAEGKDENHSGEHLDHSLGRL